MTWTDERIATLTKMWENGSTASQIADELGGVSRNAVIGKAHRLGLKARPSPVKANDKPATAKKKKDISEPAQAQAVAQDLPAAAPQREPIADPAPHMADDADGEDSQLVAAEPDDDAADPDDAPDAVVVMKRSEDLPRIVSYGPGGFLRQGPGEQQAPIPPAPPRRRVPAKPAPEIASKTNLLDLSDRVCRWPMGHPGEPDFHFCGEKVNPGFPYCVEHCGRAYQAQLPRGVRRPPPPLPFGGPRVR